MALTHEIVEKVPLLVRARECRTATWTGVRYAGPLPPEEIKSDFTPPRGISGRHATITWRLSEEVDATERAVSTSSMTSSSRFHQTSHGIVHTNGETLHQLRLSNTSIEITPNNNLNTNLNHTRIHQAMQMLNTPFNSASFSESDRNDEYHRPLFKVDFNNSSSTTRSV